MKIHDTSIIHNGVMLGNNIEIMEYCVIGTEPILFETHKSLFGIEYVRKNPKFNVEVGNNVFIGTHTVIMKGDTRNTKIGNNIIIGQFCNVGHDSIINDNVKIMNNVAIDGYVEIGKNAFLGSGVRIRNRIKVGENSLVGMGSNVVKDIPENVMAYGNPCKVKEKRDNKFTFLIKKWLL